MNPVTRALQTIEALQSEPRGLSHAEGTSRPSIETVLARNLSASSLPPSDLSNRPTMPSANNKTATHLNRGSIAPPIAEVKGVSGPTCGDGELRIDKQDRIVILSDRGLTGRAMKIISVACLLAVVVCFGWIGEWSSSFFTEPASLPVKKVNSSAEPLSAKSKRLEVQGSLAKTIAPSSSHDTSRGGAQTVDSLLTKQTTKAPTTVVERAKGSTKPTAVPETRPTTIEGWTIREVNGSTVVLEGPNGVWKTTRGDTVPGLGKIESIVRWGNRWIVATSRGLVSTR